jgi:hypothetical protein
MTRLGAITYDGLPISSGGAHSLRQKGFVAGFNALQGFVDAISLEREPTSVSVELFDIGSGSFSHFISLSSEFDNRFEQKNGRNIGEYLGHQWRVPASELESLIHDVERLRPIPLLGYGGRSLVVHVYWHLILFDASGIQFPFQTRDSYEDFEVGTRLHLGESLVYARISENSTASLFLSLPFENVQPECIELANRINEAFPTRLSTKHWKRWTLTKKGTSYLGRKIPAPF